MKENSILCQSSFVYPPCSQMIAFLIRVSLIDVIFHWNKLPSTHSHYSLQFHGIYSRKFTKYYRRNSQLIFLLHPVFNPACPILLKFLVQILRRTSNHKDSERTVVKNSRLTAVFVVEFPRVMKSNYNFKGPALICDAGSLYCPIWWLSNYVSNES